MSKTITAKYGNKSASITCNSNDKQTFLKSAGKALGITADEVYGARGTKIKFSIIKDGETVWVAPPISNVEPVQVQLVIMGTSAVGKTAISYQYCNKVFQERYDPTLEDAFSISQKIDGRTVLVDILDTAGMEYYQDMRRQWIAGHDGIILVYDTTRPNTFEDLNQFHDLLEQISEENKKSQKVIIFGNKIDLKDQRRVKRVDAEKQARNWNYGFEEVSAKSTENLDAAFCEIIRSLISIPEDQGVQKCFCTIL